MKINRITAYLKDLFQKAVVVLSNHKGELDLEPYLSKIMGNKKLPVHGQIQLQEQTQIKINNTIINLTTMFHGHRELKPALINWAIDKALKTK